MNIVLAQFKKDIQCQRQSLILWGICLALGVIPIAIIATLSRLQHTHLEHYSFSDTQKIVGVLSFVAVFTMCMFLAGFGMFLLLPVLVIRIVHEDTLMGTTAFWLTRPIPRLELLLAKILFIAVLLLPLILAAGYDVRVGEGQFWPAEIAWIAAVAALASITPGVQGLLGCGAALLFGKIVFSGIIDMLWRHYHGADSVFSDGMIQQFSSAGRILHLSTSDIFHLCYLVHRFIKTFTDQTARRSNAFQRWTVGAALISAIPSRMRALSSALDLTRICLKKVCAIFPKSVSTRLSQEPCLGV